MARTTKSNIEDFQQKILKWYETNGRTFPWRNEGLTSYQLVMTEVLLQRTKANVVDAFFHGFFLRFPTWGSISQNRTTTLAKFLKPLGLFNQRAKRLKNLAKEMIHRTGQFPAKRSELDTIPFIGQYIGNAIELLIFNRPLPLLDVNMSRVLERYFGKRKMADIRYDPYLQRLALDIVNHTRSKDINWAILDFAALTCTSQRPSCEICIFKSKCTYYKNR